MKKILMVLLSILMLFSSCLTISAEEDSHNVSLTVSQSENGDVTFEFSGNDAEKYINYIMDGDGYISLDSTSSGCNGYIYKDCLTRDGDKLVITKDNLISAGFFDGKYNFNLQCPNCKNTNLHFYDFSLNVGKELISNYTNSLKLVGTIDEPVGGQSNVVDYSKLYLVDSNGNKIDQNQYEIVWCVGYKQSDGSIYYGKDYSDKFIAGSDYKLEVRYAFTGHTDWEGKLTSDLDSFEASYGILSKYPSKIEEDCGNNIACEYFNYTNDAYSSNDKTSKLYTFGGIWFKGQTIYTAKSSKDLQVSATQNTNGDLVISATGNDAEEFLNSLVDVEVPSGELRATGGGFIDEGTIIDFTCGIYNGQVLNYVELTTYDEENERWNYETFTPIKKGDGCVTISKEDLIKFGYFDGTYKLSFDDPSNNYDYFELEVTLDLGVKLVPNQAKSLTLSGNIDAPVEGMSTHFDESSVTLKDQDGNAIPVIDYDKGPYTGYNIYWTERIETHYNDGFVHVNYVETDDHKFVAGKTYYLLVEYVYTKADETLPESVIEADGFKLSTVNNFFGVTFGNGINTTNVVSYICEYVAKTLEKDDTVSTGDVPATSIESTAYDLQDKILSDEDKQALKNGTEVKTYLNVSDNVSNEDVAKVESSLDGNTLDKILNIELEKKVGDTTTSISETNGNVDISIKLDDDLTNKEYSVIRVHDGKADTLKADVNYQTKELTFSTDKFSTYAVVYKLLGNSFVDVDGIAHSDEINWLANNKISEGWTIGSIKEFRPYNEVTRADMAAFIRRLAKLYNIGDAATWTPSEEDWNTFADVSKGNDYHQEDILWLAHAGISKGWTEADGSKTFRPFNGVARCDMAAFLRRLCQINSSADSNDYYVAGGEWYTFTDVGYDVDVNGNDTYHQSDILWLASVGVTTGWTEADGSKTFRPYNIVARADMAAFLQRLSLKLD